MEMLMATVVLMLMPVDGSVVGSVGESVTQSLHHIMSSSSDRCTSPPAKATIFGFISRLARPPQPDSPYRISFFGHHEHRFDYCIRILHPHLKVNPNSYHPRLVSSSPFPVSIIACCCRCLQFLAHVRSLQWRLPLHNFLLVVAYLLPKLIFVV